MKYIHLSPGSELPPIESMRPFKAIVIIESPVTVAWQHLVSAWLVNSGCFYMMAWGLECSSWDDSVDYANLDASDFKIASDDNLVMTTWHEKETLSDVFWYSQNCAIHPAHDLQNTLILHISTQENQAALERQYINASTIS